MNSSIIKMFGPSISDPSRIVNRDVPACDEQAYARAGYKRGSIADVSEPEPVLSIGSEEVSLDDDVVVDEGNEQEAQPDRSHMNKSELLETAAALGVDADKSMTKAQIIAAIEAAN